MRKYFIVLILMSLVGCVQTGVTPRESSSGSPAKKIGNANATATNENGSSVTDGVQTGEGSSSASGAESEDPEDIVTADTKIWDEEPPENEIKKDDVALMKCGLAWVKFFIWGIKDPLFRPR